MLEHNTSINSIPDLVLSSEVHFHNKGSNHLIVWFGGINEPHFSDKLSNETGFDLVTVLDTRKSWYTDGLISEHYSVQDGVSSLRKLIADHGYKKTIFCGQSSGGYGALLYGFHVGVNLCFVFSPQTRNTYDGQCKMAPHVKLEDLARLYSDRTETRLVFNMARSEKEHEDSFYWDDWRHVDGFRCHPAATFVIHPYNNHSVSVKIRDTRNLYHYVSGMINAFL